MANKYLDDNGLLYFWQKIKNLFALKADVPAKTTTTPKAPGTAKVGSETKYAAGDHVHPLQTTISGNAGTATKLETARNIDGVSFDGSSSIIHYVEAGSYVYQAAAHMLTISVPAAGFSLENGAHLYIKFHIDSNISATEYDEVSTVLFTVGTNVSVSIQGSTTLTGKAWIFNTNNIYDFVYNGTFELIGGAVSETYAAGAGLSLSNSNVFSLSTSGVTAGSAGPTAAVTGSNNTTIAVPRITVDTYGRVTELTSYNLTNKDTTYSALSASDAQAGSATTGRLITAKVMADEIERRIAAAQVGAAMFQAIVPTPQNFLDRVTATNYKKGYYWIAGTSGTYLDHVCEGGDFIYAVADKGSSVQSSDFETVQGNIIPIPNGDIDTIVAS